MLNIIRKVFFAIVTLRMTTVVMTHFNGLLGAIVAITILALGFRMVFSRNTE